MNFERAARANGRTRDELQGARCDNPLIPCTECGAEERFIAMKRADGWKLEYVDGGPEWVAYCPECAESQSYDSTKGELAAERAHSTVLRLVTIALAAGVVLLLMEVGLL